MPKIIYILTTTNKTLTTYEMFIFFTFIRLFFKEIKRIIILFLGGLLFRHRSRSSPLFYKVRNTPFNTIYPLCFLCVKQCQLLTFVEPEKDKAFSTNTHFTTLRQQVYLVLGIVSKYYLIIRSRKTICT